MSVLIEVPLKELESEFDMFTLCPKKLFVYCENEGINRINGNIEQVWERAKIKRRRTNKNINENEWSVFDTEGNWEHKKYFHRLKGWSMDVN